MPARRTRHRLAAMWFEEVRRHAGTDAPKEAMIAAAKARGFSAVDETEADAIAIPHGAIETNGGLG